MSKDWQHYRNSFIIDAHNTDAGLLKLFDSLSPIESIAALHLYYLQLDLGYLHLKIHPQYEILKYRVDFLLEYDFLTVEPLLIVVECDGHDFHEKTKEQVSRDKKRDREIQKLGYHILRYSGSEIVNNPKQIKDDVIELIMKEKKWYMKFKPYKAESTG